MDLYLLGAANPETQRVIRAVEHAEPNTKVRGFLDNDPAKAGTVFCGLPVLGGVEQVRTLAGAGVAFVNLITGSTRTRHTTTQQILEHGGQLGNLIHPTVNRELVTLGVGLYLQEQVVLQADARIGDNSSIHVGAIVAHETIVGQSVFIAHAVSISGCCEIGDGTFIGTNASILPRVRIGRWATIGAGAVVNRDVPDHAVVVGNPGRILRYNEPSES
jgi:sugar O-acyltransferase (sialic acid O-acetyltransferase NeuD family)